MPHYHSLGSFPHKRHTIFRKEDGSLYAEELLSTEGFSDIYSLAYHCHPPTLVKAIGKPVDVSPRIAIGKNMQHRSFLGFKVTPADDYLKSRRPVLVNSDVYLHLAAPRKSMSDYFFRNASAHELIFVHRGSGVLKTMYGRLEFGFGDHLVIPMGTAYQFEFDGDDNRLFIIESFHALRFPKRYVNRAGQLGEHSPFCERDIRKPAELETHDETGDFRVMVKKADELYEYTYGVHPFDVVGWDGYLYPYAFNIKDFEPLTGRVHQPPPVHQTFETPAFVTCAFVPRLYDYHPESIPAPYFHANVESDEVLYYVGGDFMSRKHVEEGMITLHPIGLAHGPHPGTIEKSIGAKETHEMAVMVDTFRPLQITEDALAIEDAGYFKSWIE